MGSVARKLRRNLDDGAVDRAHASLRMRRALTKFAASRAAASPAVVAAADAAMTAPDEQVADSADSP